MTAVSSYIVYARALNRLGWTPAEFVVAESFVVRLRGMLGRVRLPPTACRSSWRFHAALRSIRVFMAYPIDIAFIDRDGNILARYETSALGACAPAPAPGPY